MSPRQRIFFPFFCKRTAEKEEFDLQTSAAKVAACFEFVLFKYIKLYFCFLQLGVLFFVFFNALKLSTNEGKSIMFLKKLAFEVKFCTLLK